MSNDTTTKSRPTHFSVTKKDDAKPTWLDIGAAWPHKDGKGFSLKFNASPFGESEIVLRAVKAKTEG